MMLSLRARLLAALLSLLAVAALVMGGVTYRSVYLQTEELFDYQLRQMALSLRDHGEVGAADVPALTNDRLDFVVQIWSADGRVIYASRDHSVLPDRAQLGYADLQAGGQWWRTFGAVTPGRVIQVAQPLDIRERLAAAAALRSVTPLAVLAPLLALAVWWLAALTLRPLQRLTRGVRTRDAGSLEPLPTHGLPDELAPLAGALNDLLTRLGKAWHAQRDFVADAAHELRTPLTALNLQLHALRGAEGVARDQAVADLETGIQRAVRLVEQLLQLARSEPGAPGETVQALDLHAIVQAELVALAPLAAQRGTELELLSDAALPLQGQPTALASLVRNLVDNALRHGPPGSRVQVWTGVEGGTPMLRVDDAGPGLPPAERARVFDRFYRRAGEGVPGSGLGLAIVDAVARRHGARVLLLGSPLGGLRVDVVFPRI